MIKKSATNTSMASAADVFTVTSQQTMELDTEKVNDPSGGRRLFYYNKMKNAGGKKNKRVVFWDGKLKRVADISTADETFAVTFVCCALCVLLHASILSCVRACVGSALLFDMAGDHK